MSVEYKVIAKCFIDGCLRTPDKHSIITRDKAIPQDEMPSYLVAVKQKKKPAPKEAKPNTEDE